jgi:phosphoglucosamine mutase
MLKIFGTDGIRCRVNQEPMTADTCLKIAKAAGYLLSNKNQKKNRVIISKDTRLSGYLFEPLMTSGFVSMGIDVILVGPLPTSALPILIKSLRADMGVMITASHNTYEYNGLKFFDSEGDKISKVLERKIENIISDKKKYDKISTLDHESGKAFRLEDAQGRYSEYLKSTIVKKNDLKKIKVVLDCGNGATYHIAPTLFWEIGCDVTSINNQPDGRNINKECGAVDTRELSKKVLDIKADIGFAFDGDGDRIIAVDERGQKIDGDKIIALFAKHYLKSKQLNKKVIVATIMSNLGLENYLKNKLGLKLIRTDVGDFHVVTEMKKGSYVLGGEQSGHIILGNYLNTGDGILAALKIIEMISSEKTKASKIFSLYDQYPQIKTNLPIKKKPNGFFDKALNNIVKENKANNPKIRYLVRKSGTEPLIRILVEGQDSDKVVKASKIINNQIKKVLKSS